VDRDLVDTADGKHASEACSAVATGAPQDLDRDIVGLARDRYVELLEADDPPALVLDQHRVVVDLVAAGLGGRISDPHGQRASFGVIEHSQLVHTRSPRLMESA